ncbi:MAG: FKBP-type peptidyl-prolyl cis-trans isomerase [Bacteroidota bacterium]
MKILGQLIAIALFVSAFQACNNGAGADAPNTANVELATIEDTMMYGIGAYNVDLLKNQFKIEEPNLSVIYKGMQDGLEDQAMFSQEEFNTIAQSFFQRQAERAGVENLEKGKAFLAENATKEGIQTTESGLQYKVLEEGQGASPGPTDRVTVDYEGRLISGDVFDSSIARGEPATFGVNQVIAGWTEALQMMKPGSRWELYIPSDLAYGERGGPGGGIGPNEALIFEVKLISIEGQE